MQINKSAQTSIFKMKHIQKIKHVSENFRSSSEYKYINTSKRTSTIQFVQIAQTAIPHRTGMNHSIHLSIQNLDSSSRPCAPSHPT